MTVILMVTMFAIFLTIDYLRKGKEVNTGQPALSPGSHLGIAREPNAGPHRLG
jgi:hypothetical protein